MAAKFKAGKRAEPGESAALMRCTCCKNLRTSLTDNVVVEIIEVDLDVASPPISPASDSSASADPDPPSPSPPSVPDPHLHLPMPSHTQPVPKSFADLAKWLEEQNQRFMKLVTL